MGGAHVTVRAPLSCVRLIIVALFLALCALSAWAQSPQRFPARNVAETFFGTRIDDPYRSLENDRDPEVAAWMKVHAAHARATLEGLKGYAALKQRIVELDSASAARIGALKRAHNGTIFFTRRAASQNTYKLYVRDPSGAERLLADPDDWQKETGTPHAINYFEPSRDATLVAVGLSPGGNELASLYLIETATGKRIGEPIERARYSRPQWLPDSSGFFYTRGPEVADGAPTSEIFRNRRAYLHIVGRSASDDIEVLRPGGNGRVPIRPTDSPTIIVMPGSRYAVAMVTWACSAKSPCTARRSRRSASLALRG